MVTEVMNGDSFIICAFRWMFKRIFHKSAGRQQVDVDCRSYMHNTDGQVYPQGRASDVYFQNLLLLLDAVAAQMQESWGLCPV